MSCENKIKVLCLHGMGVNASVFKAQSAGFRDLLPPRYDFDFVNGPVACDPSPGAVEFCDGPYLGWYASPSTDQVETAHHFLDNLIASRGPFNLVMGFSQGAAVAASYLLHCQLEGRPSPFAAALFICSPLPFSKDVHYGIDNRQSFNVEWSSPLPTPRPTTVPKGLVPDCYFLRHVPTTLQRNDSGISLSDVVQKPKKIYYNMFHPTADSVRLELPSAHVYGAKDSWRQHGLDLADLCANRVMFEHGGRHEIPHSASEDIADLLEESTFRAGL